jgi:hypothetical protein
MVGNPIQDGMISVLRMSSRTSTTYWEMLESSRSNREGPIRFHSFDVSAYNVLTYSTTVTQ